MMIAVEGVDGVGKSTLSKGLVSSIGGRAKEIVYQDYMILGSAIKDMLKETPLNPVARTIFYAMNVKYTIDNILVKDAFFDDVLYVMDRYVYSTIASHQAMSIYMKDMVSLKMINRMIYPFLIEFKAPDVTFLLTVKSEERLRRLTAREDNTAMDKLESKEIEQKLYKNIEKLLRGKGAKVYEIDTTYLSKEEVLEEAVSLLRNTNIL